jgi:hypothetical protein
MDLPSIHVKIDSPVLEVRRGPAAGRATVSRPVPF